MMRKPLPGLIQVRSPGMSSVGTSVTTTALSGSESFVTRPHFIGERALDACACPTARPPLLLGGDVAQHPVVVDLGIYPGGARHGKLILHRDFPPYADLDQVSVGRLDVGHHPDGRC